MPEPEIMRYGVYAVNDGWGVYFEVHGLRAGEPLSVHPSSDEAHAAVRRYRDADARRAAWSAQ